MPPGLFVTTKGLASSSNGNTDRSCRFCVAGIVGVFTGSNVGSGLDADMTGDGAVVSVKGDLGLDRSTTSVCSAWKVVRAEESPSNWRSVSDNRHNI